MPELLPVLALLWAAPLSALPGGISTPNCNGCHAGSALTGQLALQPASELAPEQPASFTLTITDAQMSVAGFYITTQQVGTLTPETTGARLSNNEIVHSRPASAADGVVQVVFSWTPPPASGGVDFEVTSVAANGDGTSTGDHVGSARFSYVWGCPGVALYQDLDGDGFGSDHVSTLRCEAEPGWAAAGGDCVDISDSAYPGAPEVANARDDDCDGEIDEGIEFALMYPDADGDTYGDALATPFEAELTLPGYSPRAEDCDDSDALISPAAAEVCDGRDNNCNHELDEGTFAYCGIGRCAVRLERCDEECVPGEPLTETCNGLDDDCDGEADEGELCASGEVCDLQCVPATAQSTPPATEPAPSASSAPSSPTSNAQAGEDLGTGGAQPVVSLLPSTSAAPSLPGALGGSGGDDAGSVQEPQVGKASSQDPASNSCSAGPVPRPVPIRNAFWLCTLVLTLVRARRGWQPCGEPR